MKIFIYEYVIDYGGGAAVIIAETIERAAELGRIRSVEYNFNLENFYNNPKEDKTNEDGFYLVEILDTIEDKERVVLYCRGDG